MIVSASKAIKETYVAYNAIRIIEILIRNTTTESFTQLK